MQYEMCKTNFPHLHLKRKVTDDVKKDRMYIKENALHQYQFMKTMGVEPTIILKVTLEGLESANLQIKNRILY